MRSTLAAAALVLPAAAAAVPALAADADVSFTCCTYRPADVRVAVGDAVTFRPDAGHTFEDLPGGSGHPLRFVGHPALDQTGGSEPVIRRFSEAGTYAYFCKIHGTASGGGMAGRVIVEAPAAATSPAMTPAPSEPAASMASPLTVRASAPSTVRLAVLRSRGLPVRITLGDDAAVTATLRLRGRTIASARVRAASGMTTLRLRTRSGAGAGTAVLRVVATTGGRTASARRAVTVRR